MSERKRPVLLVAGARPNFMKVAPIMQSLRRYDIPVVLVHTGQHYDEALSGSIWRDLALPNPDYHLGVGSASHAVQTARIMTAFEPVLMEVKPEWVVVVGDVNSTLACSLVTSKLRYEIDCRLAHVEAGLRSRDWRMPEEVNRILTDRLSDLLLTPSRDADANLLDEGIEAHRIVFVGNVMIDAMLARLEAARALSLLSQLGLRRGGYAVVTVHRPSNVDDAVILRGILEGLIAISATMPVVLPLHPRTRNSVREFGLAGMLDGLMTLAPVGYLEMLALTDSAAVVLTDSGGLQEETTALGVPCVTLREQTERPITLSEGTNQLAPWPLTATGIHEAFLEANRRGRSVPPSRCPEGWDGKAAGRIADVLVEHRA